MEKLETILGGLGLDGAMAEVFAYLAGRKAATLEEIFEDTPLSRKAISRALEALVAEGAVGRDGPAFTMADVRTALAALLPSRCEELKSAVYSYRPPPAEKACPGVEAIRDDASTVPDFTARNIDAALDSVAMVSRSLTWLDDRSLGAVRAAVQRGVRVRIITFKHAGLKAEARALADAGAGVRSHEYSNDVRFMMVDGEFIAFAFQEPPGIVEPAYFGILIKDRGVCKMVLDHLFEPAWHDAKVVEEFRA